MTTIVMMRTADLVVSKKNPRAGDLGDIDGLATTIAAAGGVLVPLIVRGKEVLDGQRRLAAAKKAGIDTVPTMALSTDDAKDAEIALAINLARKQLGPREIARAARAIMLSFGVKAPQLLEAVRRRSARQKFIEHAAVQGAAKALGVPPHDLLGYAVVGAMEDPWWKALEAGRVDLRIMQDATALDPKALATATNEVKRGWINGTRIEELLSGRGSHKRIDRRNAAFADLDGLETIELGGLFGKGHARPRHQYDDDDGEDSGGETELLTPASAATFLRRQGEVLKALRKALDDKTFAVVQISDKGDPSGVYIDRHDLAGVETVAGADHADLLALLRGGKVHERVWGGGKQTPTLKTFDPSRATLRLGIDENGALRIAVYQPTGGRRVVVDQKTGATKTVKDTQLTMPQHEEVVRQLGGALVAAIQADSRPFYAWAAFQSLKPRESDYGSAGWAGRSEIGAGSLAKHRIDALVDAALSPIALKSVAGLGAEDHHRITALRLLAVQKIGADHPTRGILEPIRVLLWHYAIDVRTHFRPTDEWLSALAKGDLVDAIAAAAKPKKADVAAGAKKDALVACLRDVIGKDAVWWPAAKALKVYHSTGDRVAGPIVEEARTNPVRNDPKGTKNKAAARKTAAAKTKPSRPAQAKAKRPAAAKAKLRRAA